MPARLPIRWRLTLAFTLGMALVLAALGAYLWVELRARLDESLDDTLRSRLDEVAALASGAGAGAAPSGLGDEDETFLQILAPDGSLLYASAVAGGEPLVRAGSVGAAGAEPVRIEGVRPPGGEGEARVLAWRPPGEGGRIVVVGASLEDRDETLAELATLMAIGGPVGLALAALAGYLVAGRALRPVERMRGQAAEISASEPGRRLELPAADDELRRLAGTLNGMLGRLEEALERERRFVQDASHELRTPLALHRTELEVALRYAEDERELRAAVESAIGEVDRLVRLAEELLVAAREADGELSLRREEVGARALLEAARERFSARFAAAGRELRVEAGEGLRLCADPERVEQALGALLDNALRHGAGEVTLAAVARDGVVRLGVSDRGAGFPRDFLPRAFERFSRPDEARSGRGTGLGLAIVQAIAAAHGGRAAARNREGGGAEVWFELPAARSSSLHGPPGRTWSSASEEARRRT